MYKKVTKMHTENRARSSSKENKSPKLSPQQRISISISRNKTSQEEKIKKGFFLMKINSLHFPVNLL